MNKELESTIRVTGDLPPMPIVATRVMHLVEDENTSVEEIAKIVASDPAMAARVLKISNSAFYGCQRQIQTLPAAIVLLGFSTIKSLVITSSVKDVYKPFGLTEKMLWEHSIGSAMAARIIARKIITVNPEEAFLAGLLHDIGKVIMNNRDKDTFQTLVARCYNEGIAFEELEESTYSFTHAEAGALVLQKWNFPEMLVTSVLRHHSFDFTDADDFNQRSLTAIASLSDLFCARLGIGEREPQPELDLTDTVAARILRLEEDKMTQLLGLFEEAYRQGKEQFS